MTDDEIAEGTRVLREELRAGRSLVVSLHERATYGTYCMEAWSGHLCYPVAMVWFRFVHNATEVDILNCYTDEKYRGCGLLRKLLEEISTQWPQARSFVTDAVSDTALPAFQKLGFVKSAGGDGYFRSIHR